MARINKPQGEANAPEQEERVVETPEVNADVIAEPAQRSAEKKEEIALRYGQCIIAPVSHPEEEILTTIDDWNSLYNAGANKGRFALKAEKKSS